ncbi:MAG TPA: antibiotic biosynthesis monooxygenase, partial [Burkholderiales bacterium]|nr:antibiotic biosynthesis monooxygenase [Burkholderiales bacterium]
MIVTVFRSRVKPGLMDEYVAWATKMSELARTMPGYVSHKGFLSEDGERCTIVEFESEETHRAWAEHPAHREAQKLGRQKFYSEYSIHVCTATRSNSFRASDGS